MGTSLNKKSVDPAVDYEKFAEDVGRAAYLKLRAHEQREKGRSSGDRTAKDKGAPNTSLLAGRALMENEKKAQDDAETVLSRSGSNKKNAFLYSVTVQLQANETALDMTALRYRSIKPSGDEPQSRQIGSR
ncbi:hypothetical protein E4U38_007759 [Claviceps purpurea]|nr:hypothetical protein E4U38_007759 [Claviceps purpurea]KAG6181137.1 hypothetical protein E4U10_007396 [Claviceps purpurea]